MEFLSVRRREVGVIMVVSGFGFRICWFIDEMDSTDFTELLKKNISNLLF